mmetsp:Transcript_5851/g.15259  ORF Transcript_5851/g.15259 Transcript_5851/m.15259 type:complete len:256 (+) Transcript_5851:701-1468(+)
MVMVDQPVILERGVRKLEVAFVDHVVHELGHADVARRALLEDGSDLLPPAQPTRQEVVNRRRRHCDIKLLPLAPGGGEWDKEAEAVVSALEALAGGVVAVERDPRGANHGDCLLIQALDDSAQLVSPAGQLRKWPVLCLPPLAVPRQVVHAAYLSLHCLLERRDTEHVLASVLERRKAIADMVALLIAPQEHAKEEARLLLVLWDHAVEPLGVLTALCERLVQACLRVHGIAVVVRAHAASHAALVVFIPERDLL